MDMKKMLEQLGSNSGLMQEMQNKLQAAQAEIQAKHERETVTASSGAGMATATVNLKGKIINLDISDELLNESAEVIKEMTISAINTAVDKAHAEAAKDMAAFGRQFGLPGS